MTMQTETERTETAEPRVQRFAEACRHQGLRVTPQRVEVYRAVVLGADHPSVETVLARVRARLPNVSLDTVYRTLATLDTRDLVRRVEVLDGRARYDANLERHHHCVCVRCQRVTDVRWPELDSLSVPPQTDEWGAIDRICAEIRGVCHCCGSSTTRS
jgi:Fur family peroxide stress response transcriptional regulator